MPSTRTPNAFKALTVPCTVAAPAGATAPTTVLPASVFELLANPKRLLPGVVDVLANAVTGSDDPPAPEIVAGIGEPAGNVATELMSVANITRCRAPDRNPTPPNVPEAGSTFDEKAGTSPLVPGLVCVAKAPAGPLSKFDPLPLPSNPAPVAT